MSISPTAGQLSSASGCRLNNLPVLAEALPSAWGSASFRADQIGRICVPRRAPRHWPRGSAVNASKSSRWCSPWVACWASVRLALVVPSVRVALTWRRARWSSPLRGVVSAGSGAACAARVVGALVVVLMRASAISLMPELEMLSVYLVVVVRADRQAAGLFGSPAGAISPIDIASGMLRGGTRRANYGGYYAG